MSTASQPITSSQDRTELILAYLPRVRWIAMGLRGRLPRNVPLDDLISVGVLGLIAAIDRFDASQNVKLTTYADYRIRGSILDSVRVLDSIPAHKRAKMKMIHNATEAAAQKLHTVPDKEEIAKELGISVAEYHEWLFDVRPHYVSSLECEFTVGSYKGKLADLLATDNTMAPDQVLEQIELRQLLDRAFSCLPPTHYRVMDFYYRQGLRIQEIAKILGLHASRIWQMKDDATGRVRDFIQENWKVSKNRRATAVSEQRG